ncbi:hypothetical protein B0J13DRAFT_48130 [Dactylonectria estremocensis]|uniref:Uncharacterized protein n=1 Tax=Dactylonectria estremocensis TaxID=1079267 RepID=A0A9P9J1H4_9HYPO|nr:hypothetical protein B0J13DRAFT_48130 [Dactylonectria estremocensis]
MALRFLVAVGHSLLRVAGRPIPVLYGSLLICSLFAVPQASGFCVFLSHPVAASTPVLAVDRRISDRPVLGTSPPVVASVGLEFFVLPFPSRLNLLFLDVCRIVWVGACVASSTTSTTILSIPSRKKNVKTGRREVSGLRLTVVQSHHRQAQVALLRLQHGMRLWKAYNAPLAV